MPVFFTDQLGETIRLENRPKRIVSLVPSQTELLFHLGLDNEVVGITKFCIHPNEWFTRKTRIGGTKTIDIEKVRLLSPDLIIGNKEENTKEDIDKLREIAPVWMSDVLTFDNALEMLSQLGNLVGKSKQGKTICEQISNEFAALKPHGANWKCAYFIWNDPLFVAGKNTFIDAILQKCGFVNCCSTSRYPEWNDAEMATPDIVFLSSEPFPFSNKHVLAFQQRFPFAKIHIVDGEVFSWYGSRMLEAPSYLQKLIDQLTSQQESN